jgi:hypothetical protein
MIPSTEDVSASVASFVGEMEVMVAAHKAALEECERQTLGERSWPLRSPPISEI